MKMRLVDQVLANCLDQLVTVMNPDGHLGWWVAQLVWELDVEKYCTRGPLDVQAPSSLFLIAADAADVFGLQHL